MPLETHAGSIAFVCLVTESEPKASIYIYIYIKAHSHSHSLFQIEISFHSLGKERECTKQRCRSYARRSNGGHPCTPPWKTDLTTTLASTPLFLSMACFFTLPFPPNPPRMPKTPLPNSPSSTSPVLFTYSQGRPSPRPTPTQKNKNNHNYRLITTNSLVL